MIPDPLSLLTAIGSGLRLLTGGQNAPAERPTSDAASFADLLKRAEEGAIGSGLPISIARGVDVELTDEQLEQLAHLADQAEAAGLTNVLVLTAPGPATEGEDLEANREGPALLLDVQGRTITGVAEPTQKVISGVDGVLRLGEAEEADRGPALLPTGLHARLRLAMRDGDEGRSTAA